MTEHNAGRCILVVDDEPQILRALDTILGSRDFEVVTAASAREALDLLMQRTPDLVIIDLTLPDIDGIDLCRQLRSWLATPIMVLSVRDDERDKIAALEQGADDFLTKPFSAGELVARVNALLRRISGTTTAVPTVCAGDLRIDIADHRVERCGELVLLTPLEFSILALLARHADRLVTWTQISEAVWGVEAMVDVRTIRVHVSNLRKKIEPDPAVPRHILTEPGMGLRFNTQ